MVVAVGLLQAALTLRYQSNVSVELEQLKSGIEKSQILYSKRIEAQTALLEMLSSLSSWSGYRNDPTAMTKDEFEAEMATGRILVQDTRSAIFKAYPVVPPSVRQSLAMARRGIDFVDWQIRISRQVQPSPCESFDNHHVCTDTVDLRYESRFIDIHRFMLDTREFLQKASDKLQIFISADVGDVDFSNVDDGYPVTSPPSMDCGGVVETRFDDDKDGVENCNDDCRDTPPNSQVDSSGCSVK